MQSLLKRRFNLRNDEAILSLANPQWRPKSVERLKFYEYLATLRKP